MSPASHGARRSRERPLGGEVVWRTGWSGDARTAGRGDGSAGTLRGPRHGRAGRRAAQHQRVPDPHTSRRRRVVRGLAPHRATRAGATTRNGTASGGCSGRPRGQDCSSTGAGPCDSITVTTVSEDVTWTWTSRRWTALSSVSCNTSRGRSEGVCAFDRDYLGQSRPPPRASPKTVEKHARFAHSGAHARGGRSPDGPAGPPRPPRLP
jgi:hypothetical protein